jgi:hypothetical protein
MSRKSSASDNTDGGNALSRELKNDSAATVTRTWAFSERSATGTARPSRSAVS